MDFQILLPLVLTVLVLVVIVGVIVALVAWKRGGKGKARDTDYKVFFVLGICFLPMGVMAVATENMGFLGMGALGVVYMAIGLANRDKWK